MIKSARTKKFYFWFPAFLAVFCATACQPSKSVPGPAEAAERIRTEYESKLFQLSPRVQSHFAVRLYRVTGDPKYLQPIGFNALVLRQAFLRNLGQIESEPVPEIAGEVQTLPEIPLSAKHRKRGEIMARHKIFMLPKRLLFLAWQIQNLGMHEGSLNPDYEKALVYLKQIPFESFLLDDDVLRYNSAQAVNAIYYLKFLSIQDLENQAIEKFQNLFMKQPDDTLDTVLFENKIYGLTHFIIAASNYYQMTVPVERFNWILEYFRQNLDGILAKTKSDVIAEVGLCFKLAGLPDDPVVGKVREFILRSIDPETGVIPPKSKAFDWQSSEHRNVVAYLLLTDFDRLFPGPRLQEFSQLKYLPE